MTASPETLGVGLRTPSWGPEGYVVLVGTPRPRGPLPWFLGLQPGRKDLAYPWGTGTLSLSRHTMGRGEGSKASLRTARTGLVLPTWSRHTWEGEGFQGLGPRAWQRGVEALGRAHDVLARLSMEKRVPLSSY